MSPRADIERLRVIKTLASLVAYLRDELAWPIEADDVEDVFFDYDPRELGLAEDQAAKIKEIKQLRPLDGKQPWGIFWVNFEKKRLSVFILRRILNHLVVKRRASANKAAQRAWHLNDLLFISSYGEDIDRAITFAHFAQEEGDAGDLPVLRVLGWDGEDTVLHLADAHRTLVEKLRWPRDPNNISAWREQWGRAFTLRHREVISTTQELVEELATLAISVRKRVETILDRESERGPLRRLYAAFRATLIHDLSEDDFADVIAQTISYGLLVARFSQPANISVRNLVDMIPSTNPFLRELLGEFLAVAGRRKGAFDFDELGLQDVIDLLNDANAEAVKSDFGNRTRNEDPVIHFYERFLHAYDHAKKVQRGVFFTPQPVVSYIVRSVHELLKTEFGLEDGLADTTTWGDMIGRNRALRIPAGVKPSEPFVLVLDPATGTATFLVEVIEVIFTHLAAKWAKLGKTQTEMAQAWNNYVPEHLLPRLYGYELMMAPYTIAHMKLGLKLTEINARLGQLDLQFVLRSRVNIYLTNSLERPGDDTQGSLEGIFPALAHEAAAVTRVKRGTRFTVVIGNPPYAGLSSNMTDDTQRLVDAYKVVDGAPLKERKLWLQDDYVKFIRLAQETIQQSGGGVVGYITNHGYLDNPTFRGMRQSLMATFPTLHILDLHGNALKKERAPDGSEDENVFDIRQGVAIFLAARAKGVPSVGHSALWGTRKTKYSWLAAHEVGNATWAVVTPDSPYYFLEPQNTDFRAEYNSGWRINEAMPVNSAGIITARDHFVVDFDRDTLLERVADFANSRHSDAQVRAKYFVGCGSDKYPDGDTRGWKVPSARRRVQADKARLERIETCWYRPFDKRHIYWAEWMVDWPRPEVMGHMIAGPNVAFHVCRQSVSDHWAHVLVTRGLTDDCYVSNKTRERGYTHPLYLFARGDGLALGRNREPNFRGEFLKELSEAIGVEQAGPGSLPKGVSAEDVFQYVYAVFNSPNYRSRYAELLKVDFPRVLLPASAALLRALAKLGGQLVALHTLDMPAHARQGATYVGPGNPEVEKVVHVRETVWLDRRQTQGFRGVPEAVWDFHIGGYRVCEKWLKDRKGRVLSKEDVIHYQGILVAAAETTRLMVEIDEVIDRHGGWPGAFRVAGGRQ